MRLLIFLDTDHLSGPARLALDFSAEAQRRGHQVLMLGLVRAPGRQATRFSETMEAAGITTHLLHERFRFDPGVITQFRQVLDQFKPDLYQSHGYKGSLLGRVARRRGLPWQAMFHGFTWEGWRVRLYHALDMRWLRQADEVITVSRDFQRVLGKKGIKSDRLRWLPNAISEANLRSTASGEALRSQWLDQPGDSILLGVIGRLSPEKGPDHFLKSFSHAAAQEPALRAVLVGDGPLLAECQELARRLPGGEKVIFAGFRSDLASIYEALDVLVIPSRSEGMPTVLIEAMLMGVPVISTRVGAVPDVVADGQTALLAPIDDEAALTKAMVRLARDPALRLKLAQSAQHLARTRLSLEQRTSTLIDHAQCLIEHKPLPEIEWD